METPVIFWIFFNAIVLIFAGIKMTLIDFYKIPVEWSLLFIATIITASIFLSLRIKNKKAKSDKNGF